MKWVLVLYLMNSGRGPLSIRQVRGIESESVCQEMGKDAQRLDPKHVQGFKCYKQDASK